MNENEDYDIIVIGAGFGGPVAAKLCAEAGLKTLLIERAQNPGEKVISGLTIPIYGFLFGPEFIRNGNPPIERPADGIINYIITDINKGEIEIDDSLMIPEPFSPIISFGYNAYCQPFCEWEVKHAIKSGVIFKNSTTVSDLIKIDGFIKGIITDNGRKYFSKIIIDAEGSQGLLAVKAGIRKKYPPESISLADTYDYKLPKNIIDESFGYSVRFCWGWDEQKIAPPLGYGNGLMVWPYRNSLHFIQDQCLKLDDDIVPNLRRAFKRYHQNITEKLPWWRDLEPKPMLRAKIWQCFEIYVGIDQNLRNMPNIDNGIILIGDAAGLESTELCDGVPAAWFSAEIAAKVAITAIEQKNFSKEFLKKYDDQIKSHPLIQWSISGKSRYNLRIAQKTHDIALLRHFIHNGWGLGALTHFTKPFLKTFLSEYKKDNLIIKKWLLMFLRYYQNWIFKSYGATTPSIRELQKKKFREKKNSFLSKVLYRFTMKFINHFLEVFISIGKNILHLSVNDINDKISCLLPIFEPLYLYIIKIFKPIRIILSKKLIWWNMIAHPKHFSRFKNLEGKL